MAWCFCPLTSKIRFTLSSSFVKHHGNFPVSISTSTHITLHTSALNEGGSFLTTYSKREKERVTETHRERDRQRDRETDRDKEREREGKRGKEREREKER